MGVTAIPSERPLIIWHPANTPPDGYIKANGAAISRTAYAWLFAIIGETYGPGNGSTTFEVPDLRGEFLRGWDNGRGADSGRVFGSSQTATQISNVVSGAGLISYGNQDEDVASSNLNGVAGTTASQPRVQFKVRPRNVAGLYCIAYAP